MTVRSVLTPPDPVLREKAVPVDSVDDSIRLILDDMLETMYAANGIGLAGNQIGVAKRLAVMDLAREEEEPNPKYFVNPQVIWASDETSIYNEGCLSVPEFYDEVERPSEVRVKYYDYHGKEQELECAGLLATCIQHEIDHLNGVLFVDHLSRLKRERVLKKFAKQAKLAAS